MAIARNGRPHRISGRRIAAISVDDGEEPGNVERFREDLVDRQLFRVDVLAAD
jgi:hypothetical protein